MLEITQREDLIQEVKGNLTIPEIRVWCHPPKIDKPGDDYYIPFASFKEAHDFIKSHPEAEEAPLIAFRGVEINIYPKKDFTILTLAGPKPETPDHVHSPA